MNSGPPELEEIYVFGNQLVIYYLPTIPYLNSLTHHIRYPMAALRYLQTGTHNFCF